jgi:hypothetical protein
MLSCGEIMFLRGCRAFPGIHVEAFTAGELFERWSGRTAASLATEVIMRHHGLRIDPQRRQCQKVTDGIWTIGDSFEGTQAWGDTGSVKSSTSAKVLAAAMLREGYG